MVWGKKKKTEEESLQEQADALEKKIEEIKKKKTPQVIKEVKDNPIFQRAAKIEEPETEEAIEEQTEQAQEEEKVISKAKIVSSEILDNGLMKFVFVSNIKMGELGQEFNL